MAKKIRFPLKMEQGVEVRSLEELREHFSLARVLVYVSNGKLVTWLRDRYADEIADAIEGLDVKDGELAQKVCEIFDIEYDEHIVIDLEKEEERNRKLMILKAYTTEQRFLDVVDTIAFTQDDVYDLLDEEETTIYLCGERFSIPLGKKGMTYIGVNNPIVVVDSKEEVNWQEKNITLKDIQYDSEYQKVLKNLNEDTSGDKGVGVDDFEQRVVNFLVREFKKTEGIDLSKDAMAMQRLKKAAEEAKKELSSKISTNVLIPFIDASGRNLDVTIKRTQFDEKISSNIGSRGGSSNTYLNFMLSDREKDSSEYCCKILANEINRINYDVDENVSKIKESLKKSGLIGLANKYIENL